MPIEKDLAELLAGRLDRPDLAGPIELPSDSAGEILDLEQLARRIESAAGARPAAAFTLNARQRLVHVIEAKHPMGRARAPARLGPSLVWASALAGAILVCLASAGGASYAAAASLPGDVLFPAKTAYEQVALDLAPNASAREALSLEITERRLDESEHLIALGRAADAAQGFEAAAASLDRSSDLLEEVELPVARDQLAGELALLLPRVEQAVAAAGRSSEPEMGNAIAALTRAGNHAIEVGRRVGPQHKFEFHDGSDNDKPGGDKSRHNTGAGGEGKSSKARGRGPQRTHTPKKPAGPPSK
jgi:Domain of unknown function (DUF5667)